jgi:hypothetical protein
VRASLAKSLRGWGKIDEAEAVERALAETP